MTQPCEQATTIVRIETTLDHVVSLLEKHEEREERMMDAMEKVASQAEILHAHAETISRHEKAFDELFGIVRGKKTLAATLIEGSLGIYFIGLILIGTLIDTLAHWSLLKSIIDFFK